MLISYFGKVWVPGWPHYGSFVDDAFGHLFSKGQFRPMMPGRFKFLRWALS